MANNGSPDAMTGAQHDFLAKKYELDRAHELELNKFTHIFEVERLKLLMVLNGGAAVAWAGFLNNSSKNAQTVVMAQLWPVVAWAIGTLLAALAFHYALETQRAFTQAYHKRRRLYEWHFLRGRTDEAKLELLLAKPKQKLENGEPSKKSPEEIYAEEADKFVKRGEGAGKRTKWTFAASTGTFALGVGLAVWGMAFGSGSG